MRSTDYTPKRDGDTRLSDLLTPYPVLFRRYAWAIPIGIGCYILLLLANWLFARLTSTTGLEHVVWLVAAGGTVGLLLAIASRWRRR